MIVRRGVGGSAMPPGRPASPARVAWLGSVVFFGVLPLLVLVVLFGEAVDGDRVAFDFRPFYTAAEAVLRGESPYPPADDPLTATSGPYVYPPLPALAAIPLTTLSADAAGLLVMAALVLNALAIPLVLGVRDWRCLGLALFWPPVLSAIQTGNVTLPLALAAALAWRFRDRLTTTSTSIGVALAVKFLLWPLVIWLAATRRLGSAVLSCAFGVGLLFLSWAAIGFAGLGSYLDLLRRLEDVVGTDAYTIYVLALDLGTPGEVARTLWLGVGLGLLAAVVAVGRRGDDRSAFVLAIAAAIALSPLVWLHYFALLLVAVAIARPVLGPVWLVPLALFLSPGSGDPSPLETAATLTVAALTVALALRGARETSWGARAEVPAPSTRSARVA